MRVIKPERKPIIWNPDLFREKLIYELEKRAGLSEDNLQYIKDYPKEVKIKKSTLKNIQDYLIRNAEIFRLRYEYLGKPLGLISKEDKCYLDYSPEKVIQLHSVFQLEPWKRSVRSFYTRLFYVKLILSQDPEKERIFWQKLLSLYRDEPICQFEEIALDTIKEFTQNNLVKPLWLLNAYYTAISFRNLFVDAMQPIKPATSFQAIRQYYLRSSLHGRWVDLTELLSLLSASKKFALFFYNYSYNFTLSVIEEAFGYKPELHILD